MDRDDKAKQLIMDTQGTFGTPEGKRVLEKLSLECLEEVSTFVPNNQYGTAFNEGKRYVILYIRGILESDPNKVKQTETIKEKKNE
ncbi:hypothetical protein LCGC14_2501920 [marine sediment metagenome]|uniref:Bbp19-like phage domain-containing protein n=1 Tax=marine sediment metagenome TaxID=412755 RepID=A0A0F9DVC1_9ZZZZ